MLYAFIQTTSDVIGERQVSTVRRIIAMDPISGEAEHQYIYRQLGPAHLDNIGDAICDADRDVFYVIDHDNGKTVAANKSILQMDLDDATDTLGYDREALLEDGVYVPELLENPAAVAEAFAEADIVEVDHMELLSLPSLPDARTASTSPTALLSLASTTTSIGSMVVPTTC
ncbi:MAG: esterase-like activity of phytase family protein [Cyanobacteriota bacterium]|nr:esterase-like activity of phytase family protein [Cyanobacteriota bacterium]